jgi:cell division protein ZapA (FtsZ GTPase activity inhibitor)
MAVVQIEILGRRYSLQSDLDPEHVQAVARYVDSQLRELAGGHADQVRRDHAILAALNTASELFLLREAHGGLVDEIADRLSPLLAQVDALAADYPLSSSVGLEAVRD